MSKLVMIVTLLLWSSYSERCISEEPMIPLEPTLKDTLQLKDNYIIKSLNEFTLACDSANTYVNVKKSIKDGLLHLNKQNLTVDSLSTLFKASLLNRIIPYWEGTQWSFTGHTSVPKQGFIACGYFVSTTLKDVGVNLNRYRLAQQSPINEAASLALHSDVKVFNEETVHENIASINKYLKEGIHFIGFDQSHVGYILKQEGQLYLIHSNYLGENGVEIERVEKSDVFSSYNKYYIVEISTNQELLRNWIDNKEIIVVTSN